MRLGGGAFGGKRDALTLLAKLAEGAVVVLLAEDILWRKLRETSAELQRQEKQAKEKRAFGYPRKGDPAMQEVLQALRGFRRWVGKDEARPTVQWVILLVWRHVISYMPLC